MDYAFLIIPLLKAVTPDLLNKFKELADKTDNPIDNIIVDFLIVISSGDAQLKNDIDSLKKRVRKVEKELSKTDKL